MRKTNLIERIHTQKKRKPVGIRIQGIDGGVLAFYNVEMEQEMMDRWARLMGSKELARLFAIGPTLRAVRGLLSITQDELAKRCQVSRRTIHKIENGSINIDLATIWAIRSGLRSFGVTLQIEKGRYILSAAAIDVNENLSRVIGDEATDLLVDMEKWIF